MNQKNKFINNSSCLKLIKQREIQDSINSVVPKKLHVRDEFIERLGLETTLKGHNGCVNCLEWNETGSLLISGSDDVNVILWDPFRHKKLKTLQTGHHGNIFSVKFMPKSSDSLIATAAADCRIRTHDLEMKETTSVCTCHSNRVKRLATAPNIPYMLWSSSEDGTIRQFDFRTPHNCAQDTPNVLINLITHLGRYAEAKCISVNPTRPELIAVGANDPYVRLYDRRMIVPTRYQASSLTNGRTDPSSPIEDNLPVGCAQYFVPGHLPNKDNRKKFRNLASTYLTFNSEGTELLVNIGGEQIYLFDINNKKKVKVFPPLNGYVNGFDVETSSTSPVHSISQKATSSNGISNSQSVLGVKKITLGARIEALKLKANNEFEKQNFVQAITFYNKAIRLNHQAAVLYSNRAAAFMKRNWDGDVYEALRDCQTALLLEPDHVKANFRMARCLHVLRRNKEALYSIEQFIKKFPTHANTIACKALLLDIREDSVEASKSSSSQSSASSPNPNCLCVEESEEDDEESNASDANSQTDSVFGENLFEHNVFGIDIGLEISGFGLPATDKEQNWRSQAYDYELRFCGPCNITTDIKEANFFGSEGQYIVAGSDDGSFFIWDRSSTNIIRILRGDDSIVNCLQSHPSMCLLATSGIEPYVRLWSPRPQDETNQHDVKDYVTAASANQNRMNASPFELMLLNLNAIC